MPNTQQPYQHAHRESGQYDTIDAIVSPQNQLNILSKTEASRLLDASQGGLYTLFRCCALAVLNSGNTLDDGKELLERYPDFAIRVIQEERGIKLEVNGAPASAFVDGKMIHGISEHLFAVLRDVLFASSEQRLLSTDKTATPETITDAVFHMLRNAKVIRPKVDPNIIVCWGGHSISVGEYDYTKKVGYEMGLRGLDICTGCGPGAMKGPMKGATIGHAKQRLGVGRYIGITEPGIIAAEAPNPIVNELVIMPDIEKRLEAFVRTGHGIVVFPGGAGTAEEILYLLGILLHPDNRELPFPVVFTGPASAQSYFAQIDQFIATTLGAEAQSRYKIIMDDPAAVARYMVNGMSDVRAFRKKTDDAYYFNWQLKISPDFLQPFEPTHENMRDLQLQLDRPKHELAANLRRAFSGIVAGNVKDAGIRAIEKHGLFEICGDRSIMEPVDQLLSAFQEQGRMKLPGSTYTPCYRITH
ncbi:nucleotide 5'-monophosphate nucleosidase PpnN [Gilvimarinus sp. SDUM040013]|uniref:AMP nucleosidase n=1 Tax=Gilvimarinus gilvus TaxID=3058038 RepID=A0ABU4S2F3_9GAMM|nr:nucleotide 5'-monophosphate nucleosidase PpnN [Gilvimarinus sp. SDUM040013]MDO3388818.1 nucleotide 5'-monophosphate nucleosidase PpnN [Gilvimarinus sp. SDUM040013]MDX6850571.1 nucleotide 5'-monophosphate nucleosidase PpnN [Gilvimarinus sp. SDUM040013]